MKILFVEPPFQAFMHYDRWYYPAGLVQLASIAKMKGYDAKVYDGDKYFFKDLTTRERSVFMSKQRLYFDQVDNPDHYIWRHFRTVVEDYKPDIIGISVYTCKLRSALKIVQQIHAHHPSIKICVGGAHVTAVPESFITVKGVSGVFTGYADDSFFKWVAGGCPKGIIRSKANDVNLKDLPYADRGMLLFPENYNNRDLSMMMISRGCIGQCTFCSNPFLWSGKPAFRSDASVLEELIELTDKWGVKEVLIGDSSFSDIHKEVKQKAKLLRQFNLRWRANVRWATLSEELLNYFQECGCYKVHVGLESGTDKLLRYIKKGTTCDIIRKKASIINRLGLEWQLNCMIGFPIETTEDMKETVSFAMALDPTLISLNALSPLPGTEIYNEMDNLTPDKAAEVNQLFPDVCYSKYMDIKQFQNIFTEMTCTLDAFNASKQNMMPGGQCHMCISDKQHVS